MADRKHRVVLFKRDQYGMDSGRKTVKTGMRYDDAVALKGKLEDEDPDCSHWYIVEEVIPKRKAQKHPGYTCLHCGAKLKRQQFGDNYGAYGDNRFCGLNCGYSYAIRKTQAMPKVPGGAGSSR